jgi:hypothetical protein
VDFSGAHLEHLCAALDTTPDALRGDLPGAQLPGGPDVASEEHDGSPPPGAGRTGMSPTVAVRARA